MSSRTSEALLCCRCLIDLSKSYGDIGLSCEEFFAREAPSLDQYDRLRILRAVYEVTGARMEKLKEEAMNYLETDPELRDPVLSLDAAHRYHLLWQYYEIFKPLGYYLIELQGQRPQSISRH